MNFYKYFFVSIIAINATSCLSVIAKKTGLSDTKPLFEKIPFQNKEVYFLGTSHLANKTFFDNVSKIVKEYQKHDFIFYVESINDFDAKSLNKDTIALKKIRKIINIDVTNKYANNENLLLKKLIDNYQLIDQPKYSDFGIIKYKRVDYNAKQLIDFYEKENEILILDSCDLNTALGENYNCKPFNRKIKKNFTTDIILNKRNKLIYDSVLNSTDNKIIIVYGKKHYEGVSKLFKP